MTEDTNIILSFPDGREEKKEYTTAFKVLPKTGTEGITYYVINDGMDGQNYKVRVTRKKDSVAKFSNIIDLEEWKEAKKQLVNVALHNNTEEAEFIPSAGKIEVEENEYGKVLALRSENAEEMKKNYKVAMQKRKEAEIKPQTDNIVYSKDTIISENVTPSSSVAPITENLNSVQENMQTLENSTPITTNMAPTQNPVEMPSFASVSMQTQQPTQLVENSANNSMNGIINDGTMFGTEPKEVVQTITTPLIMEGPMPTLNQASSMTPSPVVTPVITPTPTTNVEQPINIQNMASAENNGITTSMHSAVQNTYMASFANVLKGIDLATQEIGEVHTKATQVVAECVNMLSKLENVKQDIQKSQESCLSTLKEVQMRDDLSRNTFNNAQQMMNQANMVQFQNNNYEEQSFQRVA